LEAPFLLFGSTAEHPDVTWGTSAGTWGAQTSTWETASGAVVVFKIDPAVVTERGVAKTGRIESGSFNPGKVFDPPQQEAVCTWIHPLMGELNASSVRWFVGHADGPAGPFNFEGPFTRGVRGFVQTKPVRGKWFVLAAEGDVAFSVQGAIANFEPGS
jgi:hypothetical protein